MRLTLTQPDDWGKAFASQAAKEGKNLSEWIGDCCFANLPVSVQRQLGDRPP